MLVFAALARAVLRVSANSTLAAVTVEECTEKAKGARNWPALGACCPGNYDTTCAVLSSACSTCKFGTYYCEMVIEASRSTLGMTGYSTANAMNATRRACDAYDLASDLPACVLESLQAAHWLSVGRCCRNESGTVCTLIADNCTDCTAASCPSAVAALNAQLPGVAEEIADQVFDDACLGYIVGAAGCAASHGWASVWECCIDSSESYCVEFAAACAVCAATPDGTACAQFRDSLGATAGEMVEACGPYEFAWCVGPARLAGNWTALGECCIAGRATEECQGLPSACALCYSNPSNIYCAPLLAQAADGLDVPSIAPAQFRSACNGLADRVATCVHSALSAKNWSGLGSCCVGATGNSLCEQFVDRCRECSEDPIATDCVTAASELMLLVGVSAEVAIDGFKAACDDYSNAVLMTTCEKLDEGKYNETEAGMSEKNAKDACDAICDTAATKPDWCPGGLSTGVLVAIIVASVVVVGVAGFAGWYFCLRKKDTSSYSPQASPAPDEKELP
jgi:hypothetical protein